MEFLKELFTEALTYEAFTQAVTNKGFKLADLSSGEYVAKGKFDDLATKNKDLSTAIGELNKQIKTFEGKDGELTTLQQKVADFELAEQIRVENEQKANADRAITDKITALFGDKKFSNDYVKNGIIADVKAQLAADSTKGIEKIFTELTYDKPYIFSSQNPPADMGGMANIDITKPTISKEQFSKMSVAQRSTLYNTDKTLYDSLKGE